MSILHGTLADVPYLVQLTRIRRTLAVPSTQSAAYAPGTRPKRVPRLLQRYISVNRMFQPPKTKRGTEIHTARLTEDAVRAIRAALKAGGRGTNLRLAREYGVSAQVISDIKYQRSWQHVPKDLPSVSSLSPAAEALAISLRKEETAARAARRQES